MDKIFKYAVDITLGHEGGYVDCEAGGATNFGISQRAYPDLDIAHLTRDEAIAIYLRDYWNGPGIHRIMPIETAQQVFDFAVHAGVRRSIRTLQLAVNESAGIPIRKTDGVDV
jgi:lysozyme family protein